MKNNFNHIPNNPNSNSSLEVYLPYKPSCPAVGLTGRLVCHNSIRHGSDTTIEALHLPTFVVVDDN